MSFEIGSISFEDGNQYPDFLYSSTPCSSNFHEDIFSEATGYRTFSKSVNMSIPEGIRLRIENAARIIAPLEAGGSVEAGAKISWGGEDGVEVSGYVKGEVHDDDGNYVEADVEQKSDGSGSATVSAGHEEK